MREFCDEWNRFYRMMRTPYKHPEGVKETSEVGHPHMSAGLHAILYACELLKPEQLVLYGFDNIRTGEFTWSITRGPGWTNYPDHHWPVEHAMIPIIADEYNVELIFR